jgi:hypothetical protein
VLTKSDSFPPRNKKVVFWGANRRVNRPPLVVGFVDRLDRVRKLQVIDCAGAVSVNDAQQLFVLLVRRLEAHHGQAVAELGVRHSPVLVLVKRAEDGSDV